MSQSDPPSQPEGSASTPPIAEYPHWRTNMVVMGFGTLALAMGFGISNPFLPLILKEIGVTGHLETAVGYVVGSYFALSFFLTPLWGAAADHYGRKLMVMRTSFGMGLVYFILPFAPSLGWFMVIYLLMGTTNGFVPATQALIATNTPISALGRSLSLVQSGTLIGGTLGPAVGAALASFLPEYRYLFWVSSGLIISAGLVALVFAKETHVRPKEPFRLNVSEGMRIIVRIPGIRLLYFINFCQMLTFLGSIPTVSVFTLNLLEGEGISTGKAVNFWVGAVSLAMTLGSALAVPLWGRLMDRLGVGRVLLVSLLVGALASLPVIFVQTPLQLTIARLCLGIMAVGISPSVVATIRQLAPKGMESRVMAYGAAFGMLGIGGGPFIAGQIGPIFGLRTFFALNSAVLFIGFLLWLRSPARIGGE